MTFTRTITLSHVLYGKDIPDSFREILTTPRNKLVKSLKAMKEPENVTKADLKLIKNYSTLLTLAADVDKYLSDVTEAEEFEDDERRDVFSELRNAEDAYSVRRLIKEWLDGSFPEIMDEQHDHYVNSWAEFAKNMQDVDSGIHEHFDFLEMSQGNEVFFAKVENGDSGAIETLENLTLDTFLSLCTNEQGDSETSLAVLMRLLNGLYDYDMKEKQMNSRAIKRVKCSVK